MPFEKSTFANDLAKVGVLSSKGAKSFKHMAKGINVRDEGFDIFNSARHSERLPRWKVFSAIEIFFSKWNVLSAVNFLMPVKC